MGSPYAILYARAFDQDLDDVPVYDAVIIRTSVALLSHQAETITRNRRPLASPVSWCPEAGWQLRVGAYRVLYSVESGAVQVLRLTFKGRKTTEEMGR